ncbi:PREDICTED: uncharacterized protein LOC109127386 [Camelina sativa]|uniref:Uncharacterized protein LOC109127386 n=1 Tax=Camelina sativa TaxID=90675 RepID=A0ABM1QLC3_CAMSA|nr:PREDICTED: uncharacterized protein LOC109127386 [Camelina sativa]
MTETESVADYSSRLSGISQESVVLGKRYKDKKLLKYNQVVGMMQAFEMQLKKKEKMNAKSFALKAEEEQKLAESQEIEDEEKVGMLVKKYFRKMERGQQKGTTLPTNTDSDKEFRKGDKHERQCAECEGYGHYKAECPNNKRKNSLQCYGCKGYGQSKTNCPSQGNKHISYITWSESDSDEEDNKGEILNNFVVLLGVIEEDEEDEALLLKEDLAKKVESDSDGEEADFSMEDQIGLLIKTMLQKTQDNSELTAQRDTLQMNVTMLSRELSEEKAKSLRLEKQLDEQLKNIKMLSKGTEDLDTLLSTGQPSTAQCYKFQNRVENLVRHDSFYPAARRVSQGYVRKDDLYCQVAYTADRTEVEQAIWYFDSGCSRHMTCAFHNLSHLEDVAGGRVTFEDGGKGTIQGKGATSGDTQPNLKDVFLVDGLKANLISVSQLCDEGLDVTFTKKDCKAVDQQGSVKLRGRRSGNNCYMCKSEVQCFNATSALNTELWHQKLGHLNVRTLLKLASQEVVCGLPNLKSHPHFICGPCKQRQADQSISGRRFIFVMVDDFTRYTWIKSEKCSIETIQSDHGGEFQNDKFDEFYGHQGITHQYSAPRTPEQN